MDPFIAIAVTLRMATAMFAETLENLQHPTRLTTESQSYHT
jgi:hypothetical protein